jgi:ferrous iron transport protein B
VLANKTPTFTRTIRVALAGNPNTGKTTIFNGITGARQHVGNYPGVTVEKKVGRRRHGEVDLDITDLPGIYSLTAYSVEEVVARDDLIQDRPDVVVDVIDATNLERNLYLALQLRELGIPLVLAFNMSDAAAEEGLEFDTDAMARDLGVRIVPTVGHRGSGITELLDAVVDAASSADREAAPAAVDYGEPVEREIAALEREIAARNGHLLEYRRRWLALKLLENDADARERAGDADLLAHADAGIERLRAELGDDPEFTIADRRYDHISRLCSTTVRASREQGSTRSDRIDAVLTHRVFGLPIFLTAMYLVFQLTFTLGAPFMDLIESGFGLLSKAIVTHYPGGPDSLVVSMLVDGVIGGVGAVLVFLPNIVLLFLAISILEGTGYMARAAFMMDRLMRKVGLHGKSFIPMLIGFGCNIPAIMATRTIESRRDRLTTMLIIPFMSCSARLTIYALIIPAFFPQVWQAPVLWIIYVIGILLAIAAAHFLRSSVFKGEASDFVMELPPYRIPSPRSVVTHMWDRAWLYVRKAGTIILGFSIVLWAMSTFPQKPGYDTDYDAQLAAAAERYAPGSEEYTAAVGRVAQERQAEELSYSIVGRIGHAIAPVIQPMGFDWRIGTAIVGAFAAKEVFVAQMGIVYSVGEADETSAELRSQLQSSYSPLVAFCIMLFALIGIPCMATVAVIKRESNSWGWAVAQFIGYTGLAYVLTVITYQIGNMLGLGV